MTKIPETFKLPSPPKRNLEALRELLARDDVVHRDDFFSIPAALKRAGLLWMGKCEGQHVWTLWLDPMLNALFDLDGLRSDPSVAVAGDTASISHPDCSQIGDVLYHFFFRKATAMSA